MRQFQYLGDFAGCHISDKPIHQHVYDFALAQIRNFRCILMPKFRLLDNLVQDFIAASNRVPKTGKKLQQPFRYIKFAGCRTQNLRGHRIKAHIRIFRARQHHFRNNSRDAAIAVIKWMYDYKPQMRDCGF